MSLPRTGHLHPFPFLHSRNTVNARGGSCSAIFRSACRQKGALTGWCPMRPSPGMRLEISFPRPAFLHFGRFALWQDPLHHHEARARLKFSIRIGRGHPKRDLSTPERLRAPCPRATRGARRMQLVAQPQALVQGPRGRTPVAPPGIWNRTPWNWPFPSAGVPDAGLRGCPSALRDQAG